MANAGDPMASFELSGRDVMHVMEDVIEESSLVWEMGVNAGSDFGVEV